MPDYLKNHGIDVFHFCWHWTWYTILQGIAETQGDDAYTMLLLDDWEVFVTYEELCEDIEELRQQPGSAHIIQLSIPRVGSPHRRIGDPVKGNPDYQYGLSGRCDCAIVFSPKGAQQMLDYANEFARSKFGTPAVLLETMSDKEQQPGWFGIAADSCLGQASEYGAACVYSEQADSMFQDRCEADILSNAKRLWDERIQDKTVAVVGRGSYLENIEQGELIDSHDLVIRLHNPLPHPQENRDMIIEDGNDSFVPVEWQNKLGRKTDMFAADLAFRNHFDIRRVFQYFRDTGGKMCIMHKFYNVNDSIRQIDIIQDEFMPVFLASMENFIRLSRQMDYAFPLPGTLLIYEILLAEPKSLYYTGFSCFQDETRLGKQAEATLARQHHPLLDLRFLREITTVNEHISTDEFTMKLFERERNLD